MIVYNATGIDIPGTRPLHVGYHIVGPGDPRIVEAVDRADELNAPCVLDWEAYGVLSDIDPEHNPDWLVQQHIDEAGQIMAEATAHNPGVAIGLYAIGILTPRRYNDIQHLTNEWRQDQGRLSVSRLASGQYHGKGLHDVLPTLYPTLYLPAVWRERSFRNPAEAVVTEVARYCRSIQKPTVPFVWHDSWSVEDWRWYLALMDREFGQCVVWAHPKHPPEGDHLQVIVDMAGSK